MQVHDCASITLDLSPAMPRNSLRMDMRLWHLLTLEFFIAGSACQIMREIPQVGVLPKGSCARQSS